MTTLENIRFGLFSDTTLDDVFDGVTDISRAVIFIGFCVGVLCNF